MGTAMTRNDWWKVVAEFVGIFFFFFIGFGSILVTQSSPVEQKLFIAGIAHGLALALAVSALGHVSGGHFNPAVTVSMMATGNISVVLGLLYIVAQVLGGILSLLALKLVVPALVYPANLGVPAPAPGMDWWQAVIFEAILTFFLVLVIFGTAVDNRGAKVGGFAIGLTVFVGAIVGGIFTGGQMNPAHAFSAEVVSGSFDNALIYWIGPILGGLIAAFLYSGLFLERETPQAEMPPESEPGLLKEG